MSAERGQVYGAAVIGNKAARYPDADGGLRERSVDAQPQRAHFWGEAGVFQFAALVLDRPDWTTMSYSTQRICCLCRSSNGHQISAELPKKSREVTGG